VINLNIIWNNCKKLDNESWIDLEDNKMFSLNKNWKNSSSKESFFISDKNDFLYNNNWDLNYVLSYYGSILGMDVISNSEIMYYNLSEIKKFKDSKILIVGGGPTTMAYDWDSKDYDYIFSCNHFYLNEKLKNVDVALATFTTETDFSANNDLFHDYMNDNSTIICFEDRMQPDEREYFGFIKEKYPNRTMYAHTRYRGKIGAAPRLLCMASLFGAREIHVVGMDGFKKGVKLGDVSDHAFETGKTRQGTHDYRLYHKHYVALWDYVLNNIGKDIKFQNLGEDHPSNMTTDISKQMFPLEIL
tara:strand:- start:260 stop:1165 length:906 start_codon:yes stop_codon:yes gene_type:complete